MSLWEIAMYVALLSAGVYALAKYVAPQIAAAIQSFKKDKEREE